MISSFLNNSWELPCDSNSTILQIVVGSELPLHRWPLFLIGNELTADLHWLTEDRTRELRGERNPVDHVRHLPANAENRNDMSELET